MATQPQARLGYVPHFDVTALDGHRVRSMREMIEEADRHLLVVIKEMRHGAKIADQHDDPGTVDLFSRLVQIHEKHEWWMRDILRTGDGLCTNSGVAAST